MKKVVGQSISNINSGVLKGNSWEVTVVMTETRDYDNGEHEEETLNAMCIDSKFEDAHKIALQSALIQFRTEVYDKGFVSLIDARKKNGKSTIDSNTVAQ